MIKSIEKSNLNDISGGTVSHGGWVSLCFYSRKGLGLVEMLESETHDLHYNDDKETESRCCTSGGDRWYGSITGSCMDSLSRPKTVQVYNEALDLTELYITEARRRKTKQNIK